MAQLMPLPLTVSCFSKIQIGFTFLVPAHLGSPGKGPLNGCVTGQPFRCQDMFLHSFWESSFHSRTLLQATLALSLVISSINMLWLFHIFCSDALIACPPFNLVWNSVVRSTIFCNQVPKVWEHIHLLQLFIVNEYAARYAIARHFLGLVDIDE